MSKLTERERLQQIIIQNSRNCGDYIPDYNYEKLITDIMKLYETE